MFKFDESKVPEVKLVNSWVLQEGETYEIYEFVGDDKNYIIEEEDDDE